MATGGSSSLSQHEASERLEQFIRTTFRVRPDDARFGRTVDLLDRGYVDSVGMVELLEFIEEQFGVALSDEDVLSDEFTTIDGMAHLIAVRAAVRA